MKTTSYSKLIQNLLLATLPPPVVASASQVFSMLMQDSSFVSKINENTKLFREGMTKAGFTISGEDHPICPVMIGDAALATQMADDMLGKLKMRNFD